MSEVQAEERRCRLCRREYEPKRVDQKWCGKDCRQAAWRWRQATERRSARGPSSALSAKGILEEISVHCELLDRPTPTIDPALELVAQIKEAQALALHWRDVHTQRLQRWQAMTHPALEARVVRVRADGIVEPPGPEETFVGLACSSGDMALVVYGKPRKGPEVPLKGGKEP